MDLDLFYGKVKFGNLGFSIGKVKTVDFSETIAACDLKVVDADNKLSLRRYISIEGQGNFLTFTQGRLCIKIKTCFSQKPQGHL